MKNLLFSLTTLVLAVSAFAQTSLAQTGYVSDMLLLTFRQGPGNSYEVIKTLQSDTPVSIMEEKNGFYKVTLQSNETGWVDKRFIVFKQPKSIVLEQLKQENSSLKDKILQLESSSQALEDAIKNLEASLKTALDEKIKTSRLLSENREKYDTLIKQSGNIHKLIKENKSLHEQNITLAGNLEKLEKSHKDLFKTSMIKWFLAGVGVLLLGWIIGQSVSSKKRRSGSSLLD
ncbi:TIGR04211 family SH3 domain-containing protein [Desulfobacula phenolica]|uniref:SH3 domain protein n=1 Tax=Desulfobacula phenolica TaxID=90732 RepID=A0A1H2EEQ5_9BACT|nr:TIGR04211 family SH3 domain-containing protein [Desulfobacula phenolica]SDT93615.1 SH3 domain protein [Desulfobacula phenolica]